MKEKKKREWKKSHIIIGIILLAAISLCVLLAIQLLNSYWMKNRWAYLPDTVTKELDVFYIAPSFIMGQEGNYNFDSKDQAQKQEFVRIVNSEKGIYDETANFYAPFYRQTAWGISGLSEKEQSRYKALAYRDVKAAFQYYRKHLNHGRPYIIAGSSEGAELVMKLVKDCLPEEEEREKLIAAYAIGTNVTESELKAYPHLRMARGEADTGCIISFSCENESSAASAASTEISAGINPLNWKTDATPAEAVQNIGACFYDGKGKLSEEIPNFCGAYLDEKSGTLKITGVEEKDYPSIETGQEQGSLSGYESSFFYRNLQNNVKVRAKQYLELMELKKQKSVSGDFGWKTNYTKLPEVSKKAVNVTAPMLQVEYWIERCQNPNDIVMSTEEIEEFNKKFISDGKETDFAYYYNHPEISEIPKEAILQLLEYSKAPESDGYYMGEKVNPGFYSDIEENIAREKVSKSHKVQYGFSVKRGSVRILPTDKAVYDDEKLPLFDLLQNSSILLNEPIIAIHTSMDGDWTYILTSYCSGWVKTENIAVCDSYRDWKAIQEEEFLMITENRFRLDVDTSDPDVSELELTMGDKLALAETGNDGMTRDGRTPLDVYAVKIPRRGLRGKIQFKKAFIPAYHSVSLGYLNYTRQNVLRLAFASHGERYGWGGTFESRDCSQYIMEIYRCFGLQFARNTSGQMAMKCRTLNLDGLSDEEKLEIIHEIPVGSCLYFPGHAMLYIGEESGNPYVISAVGTMNFQGTEDGEAIPIHSVCMNDLNVRRKSGKTWLESLTIIKIIENDKETQ